MAQYSIPIMRNTAISLVTHFILLALSTALIGFIVIANLSPLGMTTEESIDELVPKSRVEKTTQDGQVIYKQKDDLIYFTSKMPFQYDTATVRLTFKNPDPEQTLSLGFQDQENWHYNLQIFDLPLLDALSWNKIGTNPTLFQQQKNYASVSDFLHHPPKNSLVGVYDYDGDLGDVSGTRLPDYTPQKNETIIDTPLRGKNVIYAYLQNEPFHLTIEKQDLNWYQDPDPATVRVYKDNAVVYQATIDDDGIQDTSRKVLPPQTVTINSTGPGMPENGVYRIVIDANQDTIIKSIRTNLHKIVFQGSIFPAANAQIYAGIAASTSATTVYTNALALSAITYHLAGEQTLLVGDQLFPVYSLKSNQIIAPKEDLTRVIIPKNDIVIGGFQGYFAFDPSEFFLPTLYRIMPITKPDDLNLVDYVLTNSTPAEHVEGTWQTALRTFNLSSAYIKDGTLSWIIEAPKLADNDRQVFIKNITITFHKKPWI